MNLILLGQGDGDKNDNDPQIQDEKSDLPVSKKPRHGEDPAWPVSVTLQKADARFKHIVNHLKKNVGSSLRIGFVPNGPLGEAVIKSIENGSLMKLQIPLSKLRQLPPRPLVRILLGVPFPKVIKQLWPVLTSLGVDAIFYFKATLTEPGFMETSALTPAVYDRQIREGMAQAEDTRPPNVEIIRGKTLPDILQSEQSTFANATRDCCKIVLHIGDYPSIRNCALDCQKQFPNRKGIFLAVGSERGWTDLEMDAFQAANFRVASLGSPILRTDTAVISAIALARDVLLDGTTVS